MKLTEPYINILPPQSDIYVVKSNIRTDKRFDQTGLVQSISEKKMPTVEVIATEMIFVFLCPICLPKQHIQNREDRVGRK